MHKIDTIIWDWNGTLLNDTEICIQSINTLLHQRKLPLLNKNQYLDAFGFPVKEYYKRIGFDFETEAFEIPAKQFTDYYYLNVHKARLHKDAINCLEFFANNNFSQLILSASEKNKLEDVLQQFEIEKYFKSVAGLSHIYGSSKIDVGIEMMKKHGIKAQNTCLIGDTTHDYEVANAMKCTCILIANGHQAAYKLEKTGATVIQSINELIQYFLQSKTYNLVTNPLQQSYHPEK